MNALETVKRLRAKNDLRRTRHHADVLWDMLARHSSPATTDHICNHIERTEAKIAALKEELR
jgi:hypothetical protein